MRFDLLKFDLKSVIAIVTVTITMVGLYYALETRTSVLENEARALQTQINDVRNRVNTAERKIKRLTRNQP